MALPLAATVLLLASSIPAGAPPGEDALPAQLTLEDALRIARDRSPDRAIAEAGVAGAQALVRSAGALPNPAASLLVGWSSQCVDAGCNQPVFTIGLGDQGALALLVTGQRGLSVDAAEQGLLGAEASRRDVSRNLDFQVKQRFVATAVAARALVVAREEAALAERTLAHAAERHAAGTTTASDVARLEVLHLQIEQLVDRAEQGLTQARASLAQVLGLRAATPGFEVVPGPTATALPPSQLAATGLPELTTRALSLRPDLAAARAQLDQARVQASLARRQVIPQFQLQAQYQQQGTTAGGWFTPPTASVGLTVPLPVLYQQQGQIGQADASILTAEATVVRLESQVVAEVTTAHAAYQTSRQAAQRGEHRLVPRARTARESVQAQYARGTASLVDFLDAQRTHLTAQLDSLAALGAFWTAVFQLEQAVGTSYVP